MIYRVYIEDKEDSGAETSLAIHVPKLQRQRGASDCGVFAIAFSCHVARGDDVEDMEFDQGKMRSHLSNCFSNKKLLPFPTLKQLGPTTTTSLSLHLTYYCKMPATYQKLGPQPP